VSWPSWPAPNFEFKVTLGELVQITLTVATISTAVWLWYWRGRKQRQPLWLRLRDANGDHKTVRLVVGTHPIRLVLSSHVARTSSYYQLEVMERDWNWRSLRLTWVPSQTPTVLMSAVAVQPTGAPGPNATHKGPPAAHLNLPVAYFFSCAAGVQAIIDLELTSPAPCKGGIRVEVGSHGVVGERAVIPVSVA
jgi:hypothetical protein